ncbi:MAG: hypothetical protein H6810_04825 [Phycisphaeraceae bacterium]|nr:MAG: hypothetical protein H6810_04825 [Phycisphaeraceae bacterium]
MAMPRSVSLLMLVTVAAPWSVLFGAGGLWLVFSGPVVWPEARMMCLVGGITLCLLGQHVCCVLIADRVFPRGGRSVGWLVEIPSCLMLFAGCFWFCWVVFDALAATPAS